MDFLARIDEIDDLVHEAKPVPLSDQVRVDRLELASLVDALREEVAEAGHQPPPLVANQLEESAARAIYAAGERESVAQLVRLSRAVAARPVPRDAVREEIGALVDELAALVRDARPVPLTGEVRLDREVLYAFLDALRLRATDLIAAGSRPPADLDESSAGVLFHQGEGAVVEQLVRLARAAAAPERP